MAVLRNTVGVMALLAGCYSPELRDCVVACAGPDDCAPGQVCSADGRCAAPELAGTCGATAVIPDAGARGDAAMPTDAPAPPDAPATIALTVEISGQGAVAVAGVGTCGAAAAPCTYQVTPGVARSIVATPAQGWSFDRWQSVACTGQNATCSHTPSTPTTVHAKFRMDDDDD
jgi:hypothetical protein